MLEVLSEVLRPNFKCLVRTCKFSIYKRLRYISKRPARRRIETETITIDYIIYAITYVYKLVSRIQADVFTGRYQYVVQLCVHGGH